MHQSPLPRTLIEKQISGLPPAGDALSTTKPASAHVAGCGKPYGQAMKAFAPRPHDLRTERSTGLRRPIHGAVVIGDALVSALRQLPEPSRDMLRSIADELELPRSSPWGAG